MSIVPTERWPMHGMFLAAVAVALFACHPSASGQELLTMARLELQNGHSAEAIQMLESYRLRHSDVAEVYNLLGMAYTKQGSLDRALAMFGEFVRLAPDKPAGHNNVGATYLRLGDTAQAERSFRRALSLRPGDPNALYNLGALLNAQHDFTTARPLLMRALRVEHSTGIVFELASVDASLGDRKEALRLLGSMRPPPGARGVPWLRLLGALYLDEGHLKEGADALKQVLDLRPDDRVALYSLGLAYLKSNHAAEAVPLLEKSMASVPAAQRYFQVGVLLAQQGVDVEAVAAFERATASDPEFYDAHFNLAVVRFRQHEADAAAGAAERALAVRPSAEAHNLLGDIREAQGQYKEAFEHLQAAVQLEPDNEEFAFDLGLELVLHGNYDAARQLFSAAQERFPKSAKIALGLGAVEYMGGSNEAAVDAFLRSVNLNPQYEPAYTFLGEAESFAGSRTGEVVAKLAEFAHEHPKSFTAQLYYGSALVEEMEGSGALDKADSALELLRRAAALRPDVARTYYYLGEIERLRGHTPESSRLYEKAVALDPTFARALYKLGRAYLEMGKKEEGMRILVRQREVISQERESLDSRMNQIQTFVLAVRQGR